MAIAAGLLAWLRSAASQASRAQLKGARIIVTGASKGIGKDAAMIYAKAGNILLIACKRAILAPPLWQAITTSSLAAMLLLVFAKNRFT